MELNKIHLGDAYELIKKLEDKSINCVYVDIPYLHDSHGAGRGELATRKTRNDIELKGCIKLYEENKNVDNNEALRIAKNMKQSYSDIIDITEGIDYDILNEFVRVMKKINIFIWCSKSQILPIMKYFVEDKKCNFEILVWNKTNPIPCANNTWLSDIEYCLYFREKGVRLNDDYFVKSKFYTSEINQKDKALFSHPTIKPLELVKRHLLHATREKDIVLDCFMGSGTTAVACKELNRQFIGFEIDEKYWTIANNRLNGLTTDDVKKIEEGQMTLF